MKHKIEVLICRLELVIYDIIMLLLRYNHTIRLYFNELKEGYSTSEFLEQLILVCITVLMLLSAIGIALSGLIH